MPICPVCGNWYTRAEFPVCYNCGKAGLPFRPVSSKPSVEEPGSKASAMNLRELTLGLAVNAFMDLHYRDPENSIETLKLWKELASIGSGVCTTCISFASGASTFSPLHYSVSHIAHLFNVDQASLHNRLSPLVQEWSKEHPEAFPESSPVQLAVEGWRGFITGRMDRKGPILKGVNAEWPTNHFEAVCHKTGRQAGETPRDAALQHLGEPLSTTGLAFDPITLLPASQSVASTCACGVYGVSSVSQLVKAYSDGVRGVIVAKAFGWGTVQMGSDDLSWRASDVTLAELWVPVDLPLPGIAPSPFAFYLTTFDWDRFCQDLADRYDCLTHLTLPPTDKYELGEVVRDYFPPYKEEEVPDWIIEGLNDIKGLEEL